MRAACLMATIPAGVVRGADLPEVPKVPTRPPLPRPIRHQTLAFPPLGPTMRNGEVGVGSIGPNNDQVCPTDVVPSPENTTKRQINQRRKDDATF